MSRKLKRDMAFEVLAQFPEGLTYREFAHLLDSNIPIANPSAYLSNYVKIGLARISGKRVCELDGRELNVYCPNNRKHAQIIFPHKGDILHNVSEFANDPHMSRRVKIIESIINYLTRSVDELVDDFRWFPISTAPKGKSPELILGCRVTDSSILRGGYAQHPAAIYWNPYYSRWDFADQGMGRCEPTHWQPLPAAPAEGAADHDHD